MLYTIIMVVIGTILFVSQSTPSCYTNGPMIEDIYVWQRHWDGKVQQSILDHGHSFHRVVALHAEVSWSDRHKPLVHIPLDYRSLQSNSSTIGLVLRLGPYKGTYKEDDTTAKWLIQMGQAMIAEAKTNQMEVSEFQIDFDCAESKLAGYLLWIQAIRKAIAPTPLTITALPSWMDQKEFETLIRNVDSFVLQVHSVTPPRSTEHRIDLCPVDAARKAVEIAGSFEVPFRVALPTYGYLVAYDSKGNYVGLSAETLPSDWPMDSFIKEAWSDPKSIAGLVSEWENQRPCSMQGLIWFRMPIEGDRMNWPWQTFNEVRKGNIPMPKLIIDVHQSSNELIEVFLCNQGNATAFSPPEVIISWKNAKFLGGDGIQKFELFNSSTNEVVLKNASNSQRFRIKPNHRLPIGWFRLDRKTKIETKIQGLK